jgi:hypothetical protein
VSNVQRTSTTNAPPFSPIVNRNDRRRFIGGSDDRGEEVLALRPKRANNPGCSGSSRRGRGCRRCASSI